MSYIQAGSVISPKTSWKLIAVVLDNGPGQGAYALGTWDGKPRIAFRWNGTNENPLGNPQSRGLPTWTMMDENLHLLLVGQFPEDKQALACSILGIETPPMVEMKVSYHPSGRRTLMKRFSGQRMYEDAEGDLAGNLDETSFYTALWSELRRNLASGTKVVLGSLGNP